MSERSRNARVIFSMFLCLLMTAGWLIFTSTDSIAQGDGRAAEGYSCSGGQATGKLFNSNQSCPTTLTFRNIFSFFVCNMEQLSSNLMGNMYCGMVTNLTPMVMAVLTLAVMVFGAGFTIGVIPATAREFQKFLIKVAFVYVFATQAEYLVGFGYRFLVEGAREGIAASLRGVYLNSGDTITGSASVYDQLDRFLGRTMQFATDYIGANWDSNSGTENATNNPCRNAIFAVLAIMAVAFPPLFFLGLLIIVKVAVTFIRGVFGYVYAIIGIAFLLTLAPFFLSFYLFQATRPYFDKWLGYLVSFTLQMVIVFAFLSFIVTIDVRNLSGSLTEIIVPVQETQETTSLRFPWRYCTLCEFEVVTRDDAGTETVIPEDDYEDFLGRGELRCKTPQRPIRALSAVTPAEGKATPDRSVQNALLKFAFTGLLSLFILAYIIDSLLSFVPYLAQKLSGGLAGYAPQLGGGYSPSGMTTADIPGMGTYDRATGQSGVFGSFERGFYSGFSTSSRPDSISRTLSGIGQGMSRMVQGGAASRETPVEDPSIGARFFRFLVGPIGGGRD